MQDLWSLGPLREGPWWHGMSPATLCTKKQTPGSEGATPKRYLCWDLCCLLKNLLWSPIPDSFQFQKLSQWAKMIHRAFIYVTNEHVVSRESCTDLALLPLQSMAELQLTPTGVELGWWEIILKIRWKNISEPHLRSFFPLSSHIHTLLLVSVAVVKWCTNWFCMDKTTLREMCCHNLI